MAPVHADVVQRSARAEGAEVAAGLAEKSGEFGLAHLARGHRKRAMVDRPEAARMAVDFHVVRWVDENRSGAFLAHQRGEGQSIEGAAAQKPIAAEEPGIADLADDRQQHRAAPFAADADPWIKRMIVRMTAPQIPAAM